MQMENSDKHRVFLLVLVVLTALVGVIIAGLRMERFGNNAINQIMTYNRPCTPPFNNPMEVVAKANSKCPVFDSTQGFPLFTSPYIFPDYVKQHHTGADHDRMACTTAKDVFGSCEKDVSPAMPTLGKAFFDENKADKCFIQFNNKGINFEDLEQYANTLVRFKDVDKGTMVFGKQIHAFVTGFSPKTWTIPSGQYKAIYERDPRNFGMTMTMWVSLMQESAGNWVQVMGTTNEYEGTQRQRCPAVWIKPNEPRLNLTYAVSGSSTEPHVTHNLPTIEGAGIMPHMVGNWVFVSMRITPSGMDHTIDSRMRIVDFKGNEVRAGNNAAYGESQTVPKLCMDNVSRAAAGLPPTHPSLSANYFSKRLDYSGRLGGFFMYDVRLTNKPYGDECIDTIFQQGFAKLKSSTDEIPRPFVIQTTSITDDGFEFNKNESFMNNTFAEMTNPFDKMGEAKARDAIVLYIAPPVRSTVDTLRGSHPPIYHMTSKVYGITRTSNDSTGSVIIKLKGTAANNNKQEKPINDFIMQGTNKIIVLGFRYNENMSSPHIGLSDAYIFSSTSTV